MILKHILMSYGLLIDPVEHGHASKIFFPCCSTRELRGTGLTFPATAVCLESSEASKGS